jgi:choline transport protein
MTWAFSRDVSNLQYLSFIINSLTFSKNGLPFSDYWSEIDSKRNIPVRATLLSAAFCVIYGLLYIASTQAFNSIINTAVLMLNITYTVPQALLAIRGRDMLPPRYFDLGKYGYSVHIFSVLWLILSGVLFCFPTTNPPTLANMN